MIRKGTLTLCALLLVLAPVWGQDVAAILASDPTRYTAKDLPALLRAQEAAEAAGNQRAVEYLVTLRMVAQLQDPSHGTLRGEGGLPLSRSQVEADLARLREKLARLRTEGAASGPATAARDVEVKGPGEFFNRELSFLEFNRRVVAMAADANHPLMERVRFLSIASANLDEFFSIRVAGLHQDALHGTGAARSDGATPAETLAAIDREARALEAEQQRLWNEVLKPALAREGIEVLELTEADARTRRALDQVLQREILPKVEVETFTGEAQLRAGRPQLVFELPGGEQRVVRLPSELPTWIEVPGPEGTRRLVRTQEALLAHYRQAWSARGGAVRLTQNQDLWGREGTAGHRYGAPVRIETNLPQDLREGLAERIGLRAEDVYTQREVGLAETAELSELVERSELRFERIAGNETSPLGTQPFERIRAGDVLLHHPYDSFERVVEWLKAAAVDPKVEAIRISLYRTGMDSQVIEALELAARNGKQVTTLVELKARFDEPANVHNTERLRAAGVEVIHGAHGHKVHAKIAQVVRREGTNRVLYTHMATGNYHPGSARFYTDLALLTADRAIGSDVEKIFEQLRTGGQGPLNLEKVLQAPYTLRSTIVQKIDAEAQAAREGRPARIVAKMNSLNDPEIVRALYRASQAGVQIDLVVRGLCTLRPGVPGLSETIRVRSVLGQYLEHSRVYQFHSSGKVETYLSSADWMARNTTRRVETAVPVEDPRLKAQLDALLRTYLRDTAGSFRLRENGKYERVRAEEGVVESAAQREVRERMASAPDLASADQLAAAPEAWRPNLALLDEGLRARHGMGLEVIEHEAARLGERRAGTITLTSGLLEKVYREAAEAGVAPTQALAELLERLVAKKRGTTPNPEALLAAGRQGVERLGSREAGSVAESILGRYRRADRTIDWRRMTREGAGHQLAGAGKFTLAIFLQEFGYALASRDPLRLEEFFDYVATTEFYMEYGLFVAGATAGQAGYNLAYQKYLKPYLKQGFFHQVLKSQLSLAAGLALPQIVHGTFETQSFVISLGSLGISSALVHGAMGRISWVKKLQAAKGGVLRATGWVYQAAELAIVLTASSEIDRWVHGQLDRRAARRALAEAGETAARELAAATDEEGRQQAMQAYTEAWEHYRVFLYRPLFAAQEKLQRRLEPALEDVKLESDVAEEALARAEHSERLNRMLEEYARRQREGLENPERLQQVIEVFEREFREGLSEVYEENQRGTLVFQLRGDGAPGAPLERFVDAFGDEHWQVSLNRLETYDDQHAAYDALKRWLGPSHPEAVAAVDAADALVLELSADDETFFGEAGEGLRSGGLSGALDRVAGDAEDDAPTPAELGLSPTAEDAQPTAPAVEPVDEGELPASDAADAPVEEIVVVAPRREGADLDAEAPEAPADELALGEGQPLETAADVDAVLGDALGEPAPAVAVAPAARVAPADELALGEGRPLETAEVDVALGEGQPLPAAPEAPADELALGAGQPLETAAPEVDVALGDALGEPLPAAAVAPEVDAALGEGQPLPAAEAPAEVARREVEAAPEVRIDELTGEPTVAELVDAVGSSAAPEASLLTRARPATGPRARVTASELNVRLRQTASSRAVFVVLRDAPLEVLEDDGSRWIKVRIPAPQGYVHQSKLARVGARGAARIVRVEPSHLKLRREPGMQGFVQGYLLGGTELRATGVQRGWVRIEEQRAIEGYVVREAIALPAAASR